jgi:hypothetical protein
MNRIGWTLAAVLAAAWTAASPGAATAMTVIVDGDGKRVEGSGNLAEETRALSGFRSLVVQGPTDVVLKAGASERVVVRADDNVVPLVTTEVRDGKLVVGTAKGASFRTRNKIAVQVDFKQIDGVTIRGSGDVRADTIKGDLFELIIKGSGDVVIDRLDAATVAVSVAGSGDISVKEGRATTVAVVIEGSGDVSLAGVEAKQGAVRIRGSGDATVFATESLQVDVSGSGEVRYKGSPQLTKKVAGSGDVRQMR